VLLRRYGRLQLDENNCVPHFDFNLPSEHPEAVVVVVAIVVLL